MNDMEMPTNSVTKYGAPPPGTEDQCCSMCEGKTAEELSQIADYFSKKASDMRSGLSSKVTYEEFLKLCEGDRESNEEDVTEGTEE